MKFELCMQVLIDFQENPKAAQEHAKNPMVMSKIQKLVSAGIVQMRWIWEVKMWKSFGIIPNVLCVNWVD